MIYDVYDAWRQWKRWRHASLRVTSLDQNLLLSRFQLRVNKIRCGKSTFRFFFGILVFPNALWLVHVYALAVMANWSKQKIAQYLLFAVETAFQTNNYSLEAMGNQFLIKMCDAEESWLIVEARRPQCHSQQRTVQHERNVQALKCDHHSRRYDLELLSFNNVIILTTSFQFL